MLLLWTSSPMASLFGLTRKGFCMFGWFKKKCSYDVYQPSERLIYSYFDGQKTVKADPMELYKKTMAVGPELAIDIKVATAPIKGNKEAHESMLKKIRGIFSLKTLHEGGLTEIETVNLFDHFMTYCETVKKNSPISATSSTPAVDSKDTSKENQATSNSSGCGSTEKESPSAVQELSPTVSQ